MSYKDFKEEVKEKTEMDKKMKEFNSTYKAGPRVMLFMAGVVAFLAAVSTVGGYFKYKRYQWQQAQDKKDAKTEMTLIDQKTDITPRAYTGVMFFSKTEQTNHADAVLHYATRDPDAMERIRHVKVGEKKKVSEWKGIVTDKYHKYVKSYEWSEIERQ